MKEEEKHSNHIVYQSVSHMKIVATVKINQDLFVMTVAYD